MNMTESEIQEVCWKMVGREVFYCVSQLVTEVVRMSQELGENEDFLELFQGPPAYGQWECPECGHTWEDEPSDADTVNCPECAAEIDSDDCFQAEEYQEVFEHWIVSDWLADKLEDRGETVCRDFYGLTIWGRTCSGQAILLDSVIREIARDAGLLEVREGGGDEGD